MHRSAHATQHVHRGWVRVCVCVLACVRARSTAHSLLHLVAGPCHIYDNLRGVVVN